MLYEVITPPLAQRAQEVQQQRFYLIVHSKAFEHGKANSKQGVITSYSIHYTKLYDSVIILAGVIYLSHKIRNGLNYKWNWQAIPQYFFRYDQESGRWVANLIMQGLFTTIRLSVWGTVLATVLGTIVGFCVITS